MMRTYRDAGTTVPRFKAGDIIIARSLHGKNDRARWRLPKTPLLLSTRYRNLFVCERLDGQGTGVVDLNEARLVKQ
jgi:hypothetical protein